MNNKQTSLTTDVWLRRMDQLLRKHEDAHRTLAFAIEQAKRKLDTAVDQVALLEEILVGKQDELKAEKETLTGMKNDPVVLVRNYGTYRKVYHSAARPCGWIGSSENYDRLLLGEATARGKRPCDSCGYRVRLEVEAA
jgi:hypothetical protein